MVWRFSHRRRLHPWDRTESFQAERRRRTIALPAPAAEEARRNRLHQPEELLALGIRQTDET
jgi:hypothetical protein